MVVFINNGESLQDNAYREELHKKTIELLKSWAPSHIADLFINTWGNFENWRWHVYERYWYRYAEENDGVWVKTEIHILKREILNYLTELDPFKEVFPRGINRRHIEELLYFFEIHLAHHEWDTEKTLLPLEDGVIDLAQLKKLPVKCKCLDLSKLELLRHDPKYFFTWKLPHKWNIEERRPKRILGWLNKTMQGDKKKMEVLLAYLNACVTGRSDLQRFLECVGPGSTGKSTFVRLATSLVGRRNTFTTELKQLEKNRFEQSGLEGKRLVIINDSERYKGEVSVLKALTGGDSLRYEQKYVQKIRSFTPNAMVIIAANEAISPRDNSSGWTRRRLTVPFTNVIEAKDRDPDLERSFSPHMSALLRYVLAIPDKRVNELIRETAKHVPSLNQKHREILLETHTLAPWVDDCLEFKKGKKTYIGAKRGGNWKDYRSERLYPNYRAYCESANDEPVAERDFSRLLVSYLNDIVKVNAARNKDHIGRYIQGVEIKADAQQIGVISVTDLVEKSSNPVKEFLGDIASHFSPSSDNNIL